MSDNADRGERCETCRHYGHIVYPELFPPGQCRERAPDKYQVRAWGQPDPTTGLLALEVIESPFPGVWPGWKCGDYEPAAAASVAAKMETAATDGPAGQQSGTGGKEAA